MAFQLPLRNDGPSSPTPRDSTANEESLVSALQSAFSFGHPSSNSNSHQDLHSMMINSSAKEKSHMSLDIIVSSDVIPLKGTGVDVEPALLSGHVSLYLTESTSFKEITLQFRGKARVPVNPTDPHVINSAPSVYIVCSHEWSFLEGQKKHNHTLKPGRHLFPFQLRLGGSLPSTISTPAYGGASVNYKLRAMAVRPAFSSNLTAMCPIILIRSLASEALEYQQTMEIENTWPEKLMYSIMLPHKAWAAGDELLTLIKFTPLAKGVRVLSITTYINETTKTFTRSGHLETTKAVITRKHEIINGRAVSVEEHHRPTVHNPFHHRDGSGHHAPRSVLGTPASSSRNLEGYFASGANSSSLDGLSNLSSPAGEALIDDSHFPPEFRSSSPSSDDGESRDVFTSYTIPLPKKMTPSHALDPIQVSHRVRWSILIYNSDGHTSELRCSLPIHILDYSVLEEARRATKAARALLLGLDQPEENDDNELPSYPAHVRDRIANVYLPESSTLRVTNPWVHNQVDPVNGHVSGIRTPASGVMSPLEARYHGSAHLPATPDATDSSPLEWVNSELLLSLSDRAPPAPTHDGVIQTPPEAESVSSSRSVSRRPSRRSSRANSRANSRTNSPERPAGPPTGSAEDTHIHSQSSSSRQTHNLFSVNMKPLTSLSTPWSSNRIHSSHGSGTMTPATESQLRLPTPSTLDPNSGAALLHRAFTETPDYEVAARGFLGGGVPPLESMRGLPSYEEVRSASDSNLAAHFQRAQALAMAVPEPLMAHTAPTTPGA